MAIPVRPSPPWSYEGQALRAGPCDDCQGRADPGHRITRRWASGARTYLRTHRTLYVCSPCLARRGLTPTP